METSIELGYAGVVIGRVTVAGAVDENSLFLPVSDPLPVGTKVSLKIDGRAAEARVISVTETAEPGKAGMHVRVGPAATASAPAPADSSAPTRAEFSAPAPAESSAPAPAESSAPAPAESSAPAPAAPNAADASTPVTAAADTRGAPTAEMPVESSESQLNDGPGDGAPSGDEVGGNSGPNPGGGGGGRRRRRRR